MEKNDVALRNLENRMGQLANKLQRKPQGALPSDTENPRSKSKEHYKVVTLRNGKTLEPKVVKFNTYDNCRSIIKKSYLVKVKIPPPPYPQRFQKQKQDVQFKNFLDMLEQLHINIHLVEALEQMPKYVKFMKETIFKRLGDFETVALIKTLQCILANKLPPKMKDPGSFTIPGNTGDSYSGMTLYDLGTSINLMSMSVSKRSCIVEIRPTMVTLQLADKSLAHLKGKIEDVLKGNSPYEFKTIR
ncbi:Aspartic peptidase [Gossypium australe]|uniref:Aspartic peptidase n=1 Tax=Gossypium australe TaxID=47621 RepID=A0A5B6WGQ0_9ROSI|nr:Aspartic peptidase [Gossypium australe]